MKSLQAKLIAAVSLFAFLVAAVLVGITAFTLRVLDKDTGNQLLEHRGRESAASIDKLLTATEDSVHNIHSYAFDQLELPYSKLYSLDYRQAYLEKVGQLALNEAKGNEGVLMVYYRLDDALKDEPQGFLFRKIAPEEYRTVSAIDLSLYPVDDIARAGWYYLPKRHKKGVWVGPYNDTVTGVRLLSYAEPVYTQDRFVGVIGIDIDTALICQALEQMTFYESGSACMFDGEDNLLYAKSNKTGLEKAFFSKNEENLLLAVRQSLESGHPLDYRSENGRMKLFAFRLANGMTFGLTVPCRELYAERYRLFALVSVGGILIALAGALLISGLIKKLLQPLHELTHDSKLLAAGNFDLSLSYRTTDEIGQLAAAFSAMAGSLKKYHEHFHKLACIDALTGLNTTAAFETAKTVIENEIKMHRAAFTIIMMDVNNLSTVNDSHGQEEGDRVLQDAAVCMRRTFAGFPLYRIGGDKFCAIINNTDALRLIEKLQKATAKSAQAGALPFHYPYQIAAGNATYDKSIDRNFDGTFNRAVKAMCENKKLLKRKGTAVAF